MTFRYAHAISVTYISLYSFCEHIYSKGGQKYQTANAEKNTHKIVNNHAVVSTTIFSRYKDASYALSIYKIVNNSLPHTSIIQIYMIILHRKYAIPACAVSVLQMYNMAIICLKLKYRKKNPRVKIEIIFLSLSVIIDHFNLLLKVTIQILNC